MRLITQSLSVALLSALLSGCASVKVSNLSTEKIPQGGVARSQEGLNIRAVPLTNRGEIRSRFGTDLLAHGTLPVFVEFDDQNTMGSFIILPEKCGLSFGETSAEQTAQQPRSFTGAQAVSITSAAMGSPGLYVAAAIIATSAQRANHQFTANQLETKMLSFGGHHAGYLYFQILESARSFRSCTLIVQVQRADGSAITFNFPVNLNPN